MNDVKPTRTKLKNNGKYPWGKTMKKSLGKLMENHWENQWKTRESHLVKSLRKTIGNAIGENSWKNHKGTPLKKQWGKY